MKAAPTGDQLVLTPRARSPAPKPPRPARPGSKTAARAPRPPNFPTHSIVYPAREPSAGSAAPAGSTRTVFPRKCATPRHVTPALPGRGAGPAGRGHVGVRGQERNPAASSAAAAVLRPRVPGGFLFPHVTAAGGPSLTSDEFFQEVQGTPPPHPTQRRRRTGSEGLPRCHRTSDAPRLSQLPLEKVEIKYAVSLQGNRVNIYFDFKNYNNNVQHKFEEGRFRQTSVNSKA